MAIWASGRPLWLQWLKWGAHGVKEEDAEVGRGRGRLKPAPVLKVKQLNKAKIRTPLTVCICVCLCALQHGTLCHCDGNRPEQQIKAGWGGKQEEMNITKSWRKKKDGFKSWVFLISVWCVPVHCHMLVHVQLPYTVARTVPDMGLSNDLAMVTKSQTASGVIAPVSCLFKSHGLCSERPVITAQQPSLTTHRQSVIKSERGRCNQHFPSNQPQNHCL